ncbi:MAG: nucleoside-triphosphatase [Firmicutes bacterium]|jgi:nucleoside-triphosphatase|nr:nucleoside-triphosphatase [Bacillota bacterium]MDH7496209.1 nucleoside-triphosphatase [Bacillota bacterium]
MTERKRNFFLTGPKHVGKSTILFAAVGAFSGRIGGFRVERVYDGKRLRAFRLVDLLSHESAVIAQARRGGWDVHEGGFELVGVQAIRQALAAADLIVMDELGRFELRAPTFLRTVVDALDSPIPVVGVLKADSNPFIDAIRGREDTLVVEVTPGREEDTASRLRAFLSNVVACR